MIGNGEKNISTDAMIATDANNLPHIPATTIAGLLRHAIGEEIAMRFFGKKNENDSDGNGSKIAFSEAKLIGEEGIAIDGLKMPPENEFYFYFQNLPIRQHVKITHTGTAEKHGKFDEQVIYKGSRFCFDIEMIAEDGEDLHLFHQVLNLIALNSLRVGGGSRRGFGEIKCISILEKVLNLKKEQDLDTYLNLSSNLDKDYTTWDVFINQSEKFQGIHYSLSLQPEDFFLFGSGLPDDTADITPVKEAIIVWNNNIPHFQTENLLIPGSSLKGALAHRTAYHYNLLKKNYAENTTEPVGKNIAIKTLFGSEGEKIGNSTKNKQRGKILFSDIIEPHHKTKTFNHVSIDPFTGGAIDGALFTEKTVDGRNATFTTDLWIESINDSLDSDILKALEYALIDLCNGMLPLGGGNGRGHGLFRGSIMKNETLFFNNIK